MKMPHLKIGTKIAAIAIAPMVFVVVAFVATLLVKQRDLDRQISNYVSAQARDESAKIAHSTYLLCAGTEQRNQRELAKSLEVARGILLREGGMELADATVDWSAVNQLTKEAATVTLPRVMVGRGWLGQTASFETSVPVVDETSRLTGNFCTIFQRMNDEGDMLRVSTTVRKTDGARAIGTFIPVRSPDGTRNTVVETVLRGETYRGRAYVVNDWHATAYEPIWDAARQRVIGMLYVGIGQGEINRELHDAITQMVVGKTGYVFVLGGKGEQRGKYLVSQHGKRDGESIWDSRDASGQPVIQTMIAKALGTRDGSMDYESYSWKSDESSSVRTKTAAVTYFAPWDWVIGAGAYDDDFAQVKDDFAEVERRIIITIAIVALAIGVTAGSGAWLLSRAITRPILGIMQSLNRNSARLTIASSQISAASQNLADGSGAQAASLEETSASLQEMSSMTARNAEHAARANNLARQARQAADNGGTDMQALNAAMGVIKASSDDVAKIIKTIDEIAFQTNILALNAAVEAARAGEHGAGFAVVAEEVRALAQRSAAAARETADKIEGAISRTGQGVQLSTKVAASLGEIVEKVREVDALVAEVAGASREQNEGVTQINSAVSEMDRVVQANTATAEESASAGKDLSALAVALNEAVVELTELIGESRERVESAEDAGSVPNLIDWEQTRMTSGVASIDEQHRELIELINELNRACLQRRTKDELRAMFAFLADYVKRHFSHEEQLMEQHRCPAKAKNMRAHQTFLETFSRIAEDFERQDDSTAILLDLRHLVADWLATHICHVDTGLRGCSGAARTSRQAPMQPTHSVT